MRNLIDNDHFCRHRGDSHHGYHTLYHRSSAHLFSTSSQSLVIVAAIRFLAAFQPPLTCSYGVFSTRPPLWYLAIMVAIVIAVCLTGTNVITRQALSQRAITVVLAWLSLAVCCCLRFARLPVLFQKSTPAAIDVSLMSGQCAEKLYVYK